MKIFGRPQNTTICFIVDPETIGIDRHAFPVMPYKKNGKEINRSNLYAKEILNTSRR